MRRLLALLALALLGCASAPGYGNYVANYPSKAAASVAADAVALVLKQHPEQGLRFRFAHEVHDAFGEQLADALRQRGHSVSVSSSRQEPGEHTLKYVLDPIKGTNLVRLMLTVNNIELARAYRKSADGAAVPVGPWARKEGS